ncbi:MAG: hypothetical protein FWF22_05520, partial [Treponema sp.]|nr:hypothetical protein [Treponema sp.]
YGNPSLTIIPSFAVGGKIDVIAQLVILTIVSCIALIDTLRQPCKFVRCIDDIRILCSSRTDTS